MEITEPLPAKSVHLIRTDKVMGRAGAMGIAHGKLKDALSKKEVEFQIIDKISYHYY